MPGFAWGRRGLAARELSRSLLSGRDRQPALADRYCRDLTLELVAELPDEASTLDREQILAWLESTTGRASRRTWPPDRLAVGRRLRHLAHHALGSLSSRSPLNEGARRVAVRVHSRNSTSATSFGSTNMRALLRLAAGEGRSLRRSGSSSFFIFTRSASLKPVPTLPAYFSSSPS